MTWKISTSRGTCSGCDRKFKDGESYISNITETEELLQRNDFCGSCWDNMDGGESFYYWKSEYTSTRKKSIFVDDDTLMNFFTRLEEENSDLKKNFRYLLSLILMRKKLLNFSDVFKEGDREYLVLRDKEDREYRVLNPGLDEEKIEDVKKQMMSVLHEDLFENGE